ncbi:cytochrome P450 [Streptomyces sp. N35]|uniref:cytochrome P450 n=1 Tax=Streptomyces sp. N35 TaxID=2795730 RepID=UPI0018F596A2|nr:cytochrome P450 [Streptomyces sp. N35]
MNALRRLKSDATLPLLADGYRWLPAQWESTTGPVVRTRLLGRPAVALRGPDAVRFFYEEPRIARGDALPEPVLSTLFGHGAVHTLDGRAHQVRKTLFMDLLEDPGRIDALADAVGAIWDETAGGWADGRRVVLFDEVSRILTRAVCGWAGLPLDAARVGPVARGLVAMVDGFAGGGARRVRARRGRGRAEKGLMRLIAQIRTGERKVPDGSVVDLVVHHRNADDRLIDAKTAAVELLNVIRPTVAVCWFVVFAAHALHQDPEQRRNMLDEDGYARAFTHEVRRFYPFAPFVAGVAAEELFHQGEPIEEGSLVLLDLYGQNHDEELWPLPYDFDPGRFVNRPPQRDVLVPQGGGETASGHRCPGEDITVRLLEVLTLRLARLAYAVPTQDLRIDLGRMPTRPRSGFVLTLSSAVSPAPTAARSQES